MLTNHPGGQRHRALVAAMALAIIGLFAPRIAEAHFRLIAPPNWMNQSTDGSPQKVGPCGNEPPQTASNMVTPYRPGQTVTIQFMQTVQHPGHYRVALATTSQSQLPAEPTVTPSPTDECASAEIQANPTLPTLVDGALKHTTPLNGTQTISVTLPTNVTCTNCILQVLEFMSSHGAPCFYHHCAIISIQGAPVDGGTVDSGVDASSGAGGRGGAGGASGSGGGGAGGSTSAGGAGGSAGDTGGGGSTTGGAGTGQAGSSVTGGSTGGSTSATTTSTTSGASGGSTGAGGSSATAGSSGATPPGSDTGCSCSVLGRRVTPWAAIMMGMATLLAAAGRRRRSR